MKYNLIKNVMTNISTRTAFNKLAITTFDLSFEDWYQNGYWSETNIPYTLFDGDKAISNASVNIMEILYHNRKYKYIQIGTVMTDSLYRNKGLSRFLIQQIIMDWEDNCDCIFLFANETVLDFYPKLGFEKATQYQYSLTIKESLANAQKLNMDNPQDIAMLKKYYLKSNPFSGLQAVNNFGLLMFHCSSFIKDSVYYLPQHDTVAIISQNENTLLCFDIYCDPDKNLNDIISSLAIPNTDSVILKFTPKDSINYKVSPIENDDDTLFVLKNKQNIFISEQLFFPEISHT